MVIRNLLCIAGGVAIGYYLAQNQLEKARLDGYNEGFEEGKEYSKPSAVSNDCVTCARRDESLRAMSDEEFLQRPEVLEAAAKATEAFDKYRGVTVEASEMSAEEELEAARQEAEKKRKIREEIEALRNPVVQEKMLDALEEERQREIEETFNEDLRKLREVLIPESTDVPEQSAGEQGAVAYNQISAPRKPESPKKPAVSVEIITQDEFVNSRTDCQQFSYTYFAGDDVLAGENDEPIETDLRGNYLGDETLAMLKAGPESWGGGVSLFIRNTTEQLELDIAWSAGKYSDEVDLSEVSG